MTLLVILGDIACFIAGGALIWFCKDWIMRKYKGAERFVSDLEDQVRSLKARLK